MFLLHGEVSPYFKIFNVDVNPRSGGLYQLKMIDGNAFSYCKLMVF